MPCRRCIERRKRLIEAAKARDLARVAKEAAGGLAEMAGRRADGGIDYRVKHLNINDQGANNGQPGT